MLLAIFEVVLASPISETQEDHSSGNVVEGEQQRVRVLPLKRSDLGRVRRQAEVPALTRTVHPRQFLGGFMRMFEQAEWDVIFIKMTRVLVNYFTDMGFKMMFGQTGRSLDSAGFRSLEVLDRFHDRVKKTH